MTGRGDLGGTSCTDEISFPLLIYSILISSKKIINYGNENSVEIKAISLPMFSLENMFQLLNMWSKGLLQLITEKFNVKGEEKKQEVVL